MSDALEVETTLKVALPLATVAEWFCNLDDDTQAKFFVKVARIGRERDEARRRDPNARGINFGYSWQWFQIGSHLRNCECSTDDARDMVRAIHDGLLTGNH